MASFHKMFDGDKLNLERVHFLLVDDNPQALDILSQVLAGFGVRNLTRSHSAAAARTTISKGAIDIILTDAQMPDEDGYDLIRWVRREAPEDSRYLPIMMLTGHTPQSDVRFARDCGANFVIAKPLVPRVLLERLFWLAHDERKFMESDEYVGPDRRSRHFGPPAGTEGRRKEDLRDTSGETSEPNMSQDQIDAPIQAGKGVQ